MKSFSSFFAILLDILGEYSPPFIALVIGIWYILRPSSFDTNALLAAILSILGFTALGTFKRSLQLKKIEKTTVDNYDLSLQEFGGSVKAHSFFLRDSDLLKQLSNTAIENARQIHLSGMSLRRTIRTLQPILENRILAGTQVKIILLDSTDKTLMQELFSRSAGARTAEGWQEALKGTREDIQTIVSALPKHAKGSLEIGYLPYIPSFGLALINPKVQTDSKLCFVELYHHKSTMKNPTFVIHQENDDDWYKFFSTQYDLLWKSCERTEKLL